MSSVAPASKPHTPQRVMIIAGEASGDLHAAKVVHAVLRKEPTIEFFGIGGDCMREAGVETLVDSAELAVVGLFEVLAHRKVIFGALDQMRQILRTTPPDLLLLTDYPEFNLRLAKTAKECGVKVLYYISPQVWAWRQHRVHTIRKRVDMMAVVFPFEEAFYLKHNVPVRFVGHPLVEEVNASADRNTLCREFGVDPSRPVLGLFPGSRRSELKRLLQTIMESAQELARQRTDIQFLLPLASTLKADMVIPAITLSGLDIKLIRHRSHDVIASCDAIITVSGTVTLEIALLGTPLVVINRIAWLSYYIVKRLLKIPYIGLCNIVANKEIAPEFIQHRATPKNISGALLRILNDDSYRMNMRNELGQVRGRLGASGGIENMAKLTLEMLGK